MTRHSRHILIFIVSLLAFGGANFAVWAADPAQAFFKSIPDLPLMNGLSEKHDQATLFESPEGRIAESEARGQAFLPQKIRGFYEAALPQLGWKNTGNLGFERENERLELTLIPPTANAPVEVTVRVLLKPLQGAHQ
jgi:hypothetical protein